MTLYLIPSIASEQVGITAPQVTVTATVRPCWWGEPSSSHRHVHSSLEARQIPPRDMDLFRIILPGKVRSDLRARNQQDEVTWQHFVPDNNIAI